MGEIEKKLSPINPCPHKFTMVFMKVEGLGGVWPLGFLSTAPALKLHPAARAEPSLTRPGKAEWRNEGEGHGDEAKKGLFTQGEQVLGKALSKHNEGMGTVQESLFTSLLNRQQKQQLKRWEETQR